MGVIRQAKPFIQYRHGGHKLEAGSIVALFIKLQRFVWVVDATTEALQGKLEAG